MSDETQNDDLNDPLAILQRLDPQPVHLDRDRFFFSAGESSARGEIRHSRRLTTFWPAAAAALALVCVVLGLQIARMSDDLARLPIREGGIVTQQEKDEPDALVPDGPGKAIEVSTFDSRVVERNRISPHSGPLRAGDRYVDVSRWIPAQRSTSAHGDTIRVHEQDKRKTYLEIRKELSAT